MLGKWRVAIAMVLLLVSISAPAQAAISKTLYIKAAVAPYAVFSWDQPVANLEVVLTEDTMIWPSFAVATNTPVRVQLESVGFPNLLLNECVTYQVFDRPSIPSIEPDLSGTTRTDVFQGQGSQSFTLAGATRYYGWLNVQFRGTHLAREAWWEVPSDTYEDEIVATVLVL